MFCLTIIAIICAFGIGWLGRASCAPARHTTDEFITHAFAFHLIHCEKDALSLCRNGINWPMDELERIVKGICGHQMCFGEALEHLRELEKKLKGIAV